MNWSRFKLSEETLKDTLQVGCELLFVFCTWLYSVLTEAPEKRFTDFFNKTGSMELLPTGLKIACNMISLAVKTNRAWLM